WSLATPTGALPVGRLSAAAAIDPTSDRMILFGGASTGADLSDVWSLPMTSGAVFSEITPDGAAPAPRSGHGAIYDPVRDRMVRVGEQPGLGAVPHRHADLVVHRAVGHAAASESRTSRGLRSGARPHAGVRWRALSSPADHR